MSVSYMRGQGGARSVRNDQQSEHVVNESKPTVVNLTNRVSLHAIEGGHSCESHIDNADGLERQRFIPIS